MAELARIGLTEQPIVASSPNPPCYSILHGGPQQDNLQPFRHFA